MRIGFTCAYTPLALIDAAGGEPYRLHPSFTEAEDEAGRVLHDNMCPHVKRVLDRVIAPDLPDLDGVVLMSSCDAMRRLSDAWRHVRPEDRVALVDLPPSAGEREARFFAAELRRLAATFAEWGGETFDDEALRRAIELKDTLVDKVEALRVRLREGKLAGGSPALQQIYNDISACSTKASLEVVDARLRAPEAEGASEGVPVFLFGNVLPNPGAFELFERCGARIVADDLCTGSRLLTRVGPVEDGDDPIDALAHALLGQAACARTITPGQPGKIGADVVESARRAGARAVIAQVIKFCDPYLGRIPAVRDACAAADLPLLILEGDCTLRTMGQQSTRIEAFMEMVG